MKSAFPLLVLAASLNLVRPAAGAIDTGLLSLAPESTVLVTSIDADATRNSDFGQYLLRRMSSEDQHLQQFITDTGFDPRRDLQDFLVVSLRPSHAQGSSKFAILARGNFDVNRISASVKANKTFARQPYSGTTLFIRRTPGDDSAFAFVDTGVAVLGNVATVKEILDRRTNPSTLDPGLVQRIQKVGSSNDLWFASLLSGDFLGNRIELPGAASNLKESSALQSILQSTGGVHLGNQVVLSFDATTRSPEDATSLTDVVRFLSSMIQTQRRSNASATILASAMDQMDLRATGPEVHLGLSISEKNLELLAQSDSKHDQ